MLLLTMGLLRATTIRAAVDTVYAGLVAGARIGPPDWDQAVATLAIARTQYGGTPRQLIARLFLTSFTSEPADIAGIVAAHVDHLDTHSPAPDQHGDPPESPFAPPADPDGQLRFFDT